MFNVKLQQQEMFDLHWQQLNMSCFFPGNVATDNGFIIRQIYKYGGTFISGYHSVIDADLTDIYFNDNL